MKTHVLKSTSGPIWGRPVEGIARLETNAPKSHSLRNFILLLLALSIPLWTLGAIYPIQLFPGFNLYQLPLGMPMVAALILVYRERGFKGLKELLKRTYDFRNLKPKIWYLPVLLVYPSIGLLDYLIQVFSGASIPPLHFSFTSFLGYSTVFFLTFGEELGLAGYVVDRMQQRYTALLSGILIGLIWAGYHIPSFVISGYYTFNWIFWHALYTIIGRVLFVWIYNNSGKSLFSMALMHWTFGMFWILFPATGNLQKAGSYYDPRIAAIIMIFYAAIVTLIWGPKTLAKNRFARVTNAIPGENYQRKITA